MTGSDDSDTVEVHIETQGGTITKTLKPGETLQRSNITIEPVDAVPIEELEVLADEWEEIESEGGIAKALEKKEKSGQRKCAQELRELIETYGESDE